MIRKTSFTFYPHVTIARHFVRYRKSRKPFDFPLGFGGLGKSFVWSSGSSHFGRRTFFCFSFALFVAGRRTVCAFVLIWFCFGVLG